MLKVKWCVSDIDGTLLNSRRLLDGDTIAAVNEYRAAGGTFVIATGRTLLTARDVIYDLRDERVGTPVVACNGSLVMAGDGRLIHDKRLDPSAARRLAEYLVDGMFDFSCYTDDKLLYPFYGEKVKFFIERNNRLRHPIPIVAFKRIDELPLDRMQKFFIWKMTPELVESLRVNCNGDGLLSLVQSASGTLDVDPAGVSKGNGLKALADAAGIDLSAAAAFGDNFNDRTMLESVGFPVAVGNAEDDLKSVAWRVAPTNDEGGVAFMLRQFIKLGDKI